MTQQKTLLENIALGRRTIPSSLLSNPLAARTAPALLRNHTLGAKEVYYQANAALRNVLTGVETEEDLADLVKDINAIRYVLSLYIWGHKSVINTSYTVAVQDEHKLANHHLHRYKILPSPTRNTEAVLGVSVLHQLLRARE